MAERGPTLVVAAAIVRDSQILLARRYQPELPEAHLKWELPGGKVKIKESLHEALIREIREELGTEIRIVRLLPHVQSNIYHSEKDIVHSVVLAFESVLIRQAPKPHVAEDAVREVMWTSKSRLSNLDLLPGTERFLECLGEQDQASYSAINIFIRLERHTPTGQQSDFWELRSVYDLWENFNLIERHSNLINRSSHYKRHSNIKEEDIISELTKRVRSLVKSGYYIVDSNNPRFIAGTNVAPS